MPEAVIAAAARTPIGRARKGALTAMRPDELAAQLVRAALSQVPALERFGVRSQNLAEEAVKSGFFDAEITPVTQPDGTVVTTDDGPRPGVSYEAVSQLKPAFRPDGLVTPGNCCPLNDGAAALVIMSEPGRAHSASPRWPGSSPRASPPCPRRSWDSAQWRRHGRPCGGPA